MDIASLQEADLPALAELFTQFWGESSRVDAMRAAFRRMAANPAYVLLAAKQDGDLAGFGMGIICQELYGECRPFMVVEDLIVADTHRRSGAGTLVMRALEAVAVAKECCQIILVTENDRTAAHALYASLGYRCDGYVGYKKKLKERGPDDNRPGG